MQSEHAVKQDNKVAERRRESREREGDYLAAFFEWKNIFIAVEN